jgi:predicted ABC-type ATPase
MQEIIIIAGPNGAGKTSFANQFLAEETGFVFVNADEAARKLKRHGYSGGAIDVAAGRVVLKLMSQLAFEQRDFVIETTLATRTYARLIPGWRSVGYRVVLNYLRLPSVEHSLERVRKRAAAGGHDIPEATVRRRFSKSASYLEKLYKPLVDEWIVWSSVEGDIEFSESSSGA